MAFIRASSGILEASAAKKLFQEKLPGFIADVTRCTAGQIRTFWIHMGVVMVH